MTARTHRHRQWGTALGVVLALVLSAAQWFSLAHTHGPDGLTSECTVCEQAPAFAHAAAPSATPMPTAAQVAPRGVPPRPLAVRGVPTARARGPPDCFVPFV